MSEEPPTNAPAGERRLAAIVFTDAVGYSARVQQDETGTLALVRKDFARMGELCKQHGGEVLKSTGDGLLFCFSSVVQAVTCALQIQSECGYRSRTMPPARALEHRIGIHLGDVFREGGDAVGDGVNIAARLQTKARPGTICVSQSVYDAVKGKLPMQVEALGSQSFKNIAEPINVWLVTPSGSVAPWSVAKKSRASWLAAGALAVAAGMAVAFWPKLAPMFRAETLPAAPASPVGFGKSIAVLPFVNMSDDKANAYFADGVHEDILTNLAHIAELKVVSRTSVMPYRETKKSVRQVAEELHVTYVLEGSVRRAGNTVRVTSQLIRAGTDEHVWAHSYDRELKDIFAIQTALAVEIAGALQAAISPAQRARIERVATRVPAAYDRFLRARQILYDGPETTEENFLRAQSLLEEAVKLDPDYAVAWSYLGDLHANFIWQSFDASPARREQAKSAIERALRLDPDRPEVIRNYGAYLYHAFRDYAGAGEQYRRALALQPGDCETHLLLALQLRRQGAWTEALNEFGRAFDLDPSNIMAQGNYITTLVSARRYDEALRKLGPINQRERNPLAQSRIAPGVIRFKATGSTDLLAEILNGIPVAKRSGPNYFERLRQIAMFKEEWGEAARISQENNLRWEDPVEEAALQMALGNGESARRQMEDWLKKSETALKHASLSVEPLKECARAAALLGKADLARDYLEQARKKIYSNHDRIDEAGFDAVTAFVLLWTGDKDGALRALTTCLLLPGILQGNVFEIRHSPLWRPLQGDPRFEALLNDPKNNAPHF